MLIKAKKATKKTAKKTTSKAKTTRKSMGKIAHKNTVVDGIKFDSKWKQITMYI